MVLCLLAGILIYLYMAEAGPSAFYHLPCIVLLQLAWNNWSLVPVHQLGLDSVLDVTLAFLSFFLPFFSPLYVNTHITVSDTMDVLIRSTFPSSFPLGRAFKSRRQTESIELGGSWKKVGWSKRRAIDCPCVELLTGRSKTTQLDRFDLSLHLAVCSLSFDSQ